MVRFKELKQFKISKDIREINKNRVAPSASSPSATLCRVNTIGHCITCFKKADKRNGASSIKYILMKGLHDLLKVNLRDMHQAVHRSDVVQSFIRMDIPVEEGVEAMFCSSSCSAAIETFNGCIRDRTRLKENLASTLEALRDVIARSPTATDATLLINSLAGLGNKHTEVLINLGIIDELRNEIVFQCNNLPVTLIPNPVQFQLVEGNRILAQGPYRSPIPSNEEVGEPNLLFIGARCMFCWDQLPGNMENYMTPSSGHWTSLKELLFILQVNVDEVLEKAFPLPEPIQQLMQNGGWMQPHCKNLKTVLCPPCQLFPKRVAQIMKEVETTHAKMDANLNHIRANILISSNPENELRKEYLEDTRANFESAGFKAIVESIREQTSKQLRKKNWRFLGQGETQYKITLKLGGTRPTGAKSKAEFRLGGDELLLIMEMEPFRNHSFGFIRIDISGFYA